MKLGLLTVMFSGAGASLQEVLEMIQHLGLQTVELGTGNFPGNAHCNPQELLASAPKRTELLDMLAREGLEISALSCHGNVLHPEKVQAKVYVDTQNNTIELAAKLGVKTVIDFSGCPGSDEQSTLPNWVTCPWPPEYLEILNWQWERKVIPFWTKQAKFAADHGVKIALEMHPGFVVYNPETLLKLRKACGDNIGANFDPSHLFWQGINPVNAVRALGEAIFHVHAKDSKVYEQNATVNGVLDTKPYGDELHRSWIFRTCGYGHGLEWWNDFLSTLRMVGYDGTISIEHEDSLMTAWEGLAKAVAFLKQSVIFDEKGTITWA